MKDVRGMSILVTGGGSGLGAGMARRFVALGARVTICGRRADKLQAVAAELGGSCQPVTADIANAADRARLIEAAVAHGGGLDALVNNAGNMYRAPVEALDEARLLELFHTNVVAAMLLTGLAAPYLAARKGAVIFLGSIHNRRAFPGAAPYAATKGAVETLTRVLAAELGPKGVRVNCVAPGAVFTEINQRAGLADDAAALARLEAMAPLHPLGRIGTAEEVAEAVEYLVRAEWTTGAQLDVDGGLGLGTTPF
jgi:NAD(P)-dependent dehydrogenase (short-subunit alcohol dehydrogenase family)